MHVEPFTRSLLFLDINKDVLNGKGIRLAIIDDGFHKENPAFYIGKSGRDRFKFKYNEATIKLGENFGATRDALTEGRIHGTAVAAIAAGRDFEGVVSKEQEMYPGMYPGGVAQEAEVTCYSYRTNAEANASNVGPPRAPPPPAVRPAADDSHTPLPKYSPADDNDDAILKILKEIKDKNEFDVVSMSVCMDQTEKLDTVIGEILQQGTLIFAGTSNERNMCGKGYPALLGGVVSVGSLDDKGGLSKFTWVKVPYCDVYTFGEVLVPEADKDREIIKLKGTSFATPAVAGLACLALQYANDKKLCRLCRGEKIMSFFKRKREGAAPFMLTSAKEDFLTVIKKDFDSTTCTHIH